MKRDHKIYDKHQALYSLLHLLCCLDIVDDFVIKGPEIAALIIKKVSIGDINEFNPY